MNLPDMPKFVAQAILDFGLEANLRDIYGAAARIFPQWTQHYKNEDSFHASIRHTLESYCPECENYRLEREPLFRKVDRGRYRLLKPTERAVLWEELRRKRSPAG